MNTDGHGFPGRSRRGWTGSQVNRSAWSIHPSPRPFYSCPSVAGTVLHLNRSDPGEGTPTSRAGNTHQEISFVPGCRSCPLQLNPHGINVDLALWADGSGRRLDRTRFGGQRADFCFCEFPSWGDGRDEGGGGFLSEPIVPVKPDWSERRAAHVSFRERWITSKPANPRNNNVAVDGSGIAGIPLAV